MQLSKVHVSNFQSLYLKVGIMSSPCPNPVLGSGLGPSPGLCPCPNPLKSPLTCTLTSPLTSPGTSPGQNVVVSLGSSFCMRLGAIFGPRLT